MLSDFGGRFSLECTDSVTALHEKQIQLPSVVWTVDTLIKAIIRLQKSYEVKLCNVNSRIYDILKNLNRLLKSYIFTLTLNKKARSS